MLVCQLADKGGADGTSDKPARVESSYCCLREMFVILVKGVDMRALLKVSGDLTCSWGTLLPEANRPRRPDRMLERRLF